jgi:hypothetical protein
VEERIDKSRVFPGDAERIPSSQLRETHVPQPGAPLAFRRSSLVIGCQGTGKTFLLRHRKQTTHHGSVYLNLLKALHSLARDTGLGGRSVPLPAEDTKRIQAKTAALIATAVTEQCAKEAGGEVAVSLRVLDPVIPAPLRTRRRCSVAAASEMRRAVNALDVAAWPVADSAPLFLDALAGIQDAYPLPLALFLDRAEDVPTPSVRILLQLLDQSSGVLTVMAARPGISQLLPAGHDPTLVPGDHYDLYHIGADPYEKLWQSFGVQATKNFLDAQGIACPGESDLQWAVTLARDSLRLAQEFAQIAAATPSVQQLDERRRAVNALRSRKLVSTSVALVTRDGDFGNIVKSLQGRVRARLGTEPQFPVLLQMDESQRDLSLLSTTDPVRSYLLRALQIEALYLPPGRHWHPYVLPGELELAPLLAWNQENLKWLVGPGRGW